jgi:hypothetical protein
MDQFHIQFHTFVKVTLVFTRVGLMSSGLLYSLDELLGQM